MNTSLTFKLDNEMKSEFIRKCESEGKVPSKVLRGLVGRYISTNHDENTSIHVNTNHDDVALTSRNKIGQVVATVNIEVINNDGDVVATYNKGCPIARKYQTNEYKIKKC